MSALRSILAGLVSLCVLAGSLAVVPAPAAAEECPNAAFRTGPSARLPDCRAYELVTPSFKNAGAVSVERLGPEGSILVDISAAAAGLEGFPDVGLRTGPEAFYTISRAASGWTTVPDDPPSSEYEPFISQGFSDFTGDSGAGQGTVWMERKAGQPGNRVDFFMRRPDRSIVDVGPGLPPATPPGTAQELGQMARLSAVGVSTDGSRLFFASGADYWPGDRTEEGHDIHTLYEYLGVENTTPLLVGVNDRGEQISQCGVVLGSGGPRNGIANGLIRFNHNAVSADGGTVFFTAYPDNNMCKGSAPPVAELFARVDGGLPGARTVAISEPSEEDCSACYANKQLISGGQLADARFVGASADGSKVFFESAQSLLGSDTSNNIYEYDFGAPAGQRIVRVSGGDATVSNPAAEVLLVGENNLIQQVSEDGSHVYFFARGVLTRTPNRQGESATAGAFNLYVFERDSEYPSGHIAFIAQMPVEKTSEGYAPALYSSNVTPDGRFLVFTSGGDLTPDDTSVTSQVFEYDAQSGALVRVSIGQDGFNQNGNSPANFATIVSPYYSDIYDSSSYSSGLSVSADGAYVFFKSSAALTPQSLEGFNNVYEYHAGRVSLISDGQDIALRVPGPGGKAESVVHFLGTDASGADVFFSTADRLVGQDGDTNIDVYDARVDGGFPAPAPPPSCSGEGCQGVLSGAPTLLSPGSEFQAGGNPPLAGEVGGKPRKQTRRPKARRPRSKHRRASRVHAGLRGLRAGRAAAGGRADRKAGRS